MHEVHAGGEGDNRMLSEWSVLSGIAGAVIGFLVRKAWDWFEKRAEADTPENDKWELYTLLTYCDEDGPVATRRLSIKRLNELCIASINSHRASNNYLPRLTMKQFRVEIVHNLDHAELLEIAQRPSLYDKLLLLRYADRYSLTPEGTNQIRPGSGRNKLDSSAPEFMLLETLERSSRSIREMHTALDKSNDTGIREFRSEMISPLERDGLIERTVHSSLIDSLVRRAFRNRVLYQLTSKGRDASRDIFEERREFLYGILNRRLPRSSQNAEQIVRVDNHQRDRMRRQFWDDMNDKILEKEEELEQLRGVLHQSGGDKSGSEDDDSPDTAQSLRGDVRAVEHQLDQLTVERNEFVSFYETCEDWVIKAYLDRKQDDTAANKDANTVEHKTSNVIHELKGKRRGTTAVAHGFFEEATEEGPRPRFVVIEGSSALLEEAPSISDTYHQLRVRLVKEGVLKVEDPRTKKYTFRSDYVFSSSSQASSVVLGRVSSGPREWREVSAEDGTQDTSIVEDSERGIVYVLTGKRRDIDVDVKAEGHFDESSSFVVIEGSHAFVDEVPSISAVYHQLRANLLDEGILACEPGTNRYVFAKDHKFSSSSQASSVVLGRVSSGPREWRHKNNPTQRLGDATP